ncbi:MAG: 3-phenylpropionate MFS transporter [Alphaproteobacteria bacterium]|nr:3-phenylpropionate MFS transporter [Alphaproteobacteria bacterium]
MTKWIALSLIHPSFIPDRLSARLSEGRRLSLFYAAVFATIGIQLPFWPLWLQSRGLSATEIGVVLAVTSWARLVVSPVAAHYVDKGRSRLGLTLIVLVAVSLALSAFLGLTHGFWLILAVNSLSAGAFSAVIPLSDNLTLLITYARRLDYGHIRLWGSFGFLVMAVCAGRVLTNTSPAAILWAILGGMALTLGAAAILPTAPPAVAAPPPRLFRGLVRQPLFWMFLVATSLIQASHSVYYGFSTLHWREAGLSSALIGGLWAEAVVAEVILFAFSDAVVARLGPGRLLVLGAAGAALRWCVLAMTTALPLLALVQVLHALSFGAAHLGAMHFIARAAPAGATARAQALYSSVAVGAMGFAMMASGQLYHQLGGFAFFTSAALAAVATVVAGFLNRHWHGGVISAVQM